MWVEKYKRFIILQKTNKNLKKISGKKFFPPNPSMNISKLRKILKSKRW